MKKDIDIGWLGETFVLYKLAKLGIKAVNLSNNFDYDLLTNNNLKIEIKTSRPTTCKDKKNEKIYYRDRWQFLNYKRVYENVTYLNTKYKNIKRNRNCDFYIFVCLNEENNIEKCYVIDKNTIKDKQCITIPRKIKRSTAKLQKFEEKWESLKNVN